MREVPLLYFCTMAPIALNKTFNGLIVKKKYTTIKKIFKFLGRL